MSVRQGFPRKPSPPLIAFCVLLVYSGWTGAYVLNHHSFLGFVKVGRQLASRAPSGSPIRASLRDPSVTNIGYDGQYYYYIAVSPTGAACCLDAPAYRYARIAYPMLARALALGIPGFVPAAMVAANLAAITGTLLLLAAWLKRKGLSTWWALLYAFYPGLFTAFQGDLTEPLGYALVAAAVFALEYGGRRRVLWSGLLFGLSGLTRETTLLFPAAFALTLVFNPAESRSRRASSAALFWVLAAAPAVAWKAWLALTFGSLAIGTGTGSEFASSPLAGLLSFHPFEAHHWIQVAGEVLPATLIATLAIYRLARGPRSAVLAAYLVNYVFLVLLLQRSSYSTYVDSGRVQSGVILAAILTLPTLLGVPRASRESMRVRRWALAIVAVSGLFWLGVALPGLAAPHTFHVFKL